MNIRPLTESDLQAVMRLSTQAGWNQLEIDWLRLMRLFPQQCLGGWIDDQLIATGTLATYGHELGWVGMMLVDEAHRRRGHGLAILDAIIALAHRLEIPTLGLDATNFGQPLYAQRGFLPWRGINRWLRQSTAPSTNVTCPAATVTDWPDILQLDRMAIGVDRSNLLRALFAEPGAMLHVVRESRPLLGFASARPGRTAAYIGPLVAQSQEIAAQLIDSLLHHISHSTMPQNVLIDTIDSNPLAPILQPRSFSIQRQLLRMYRPSPPPRLGHPSLPIAAASFALG